MSERKYYCLCDDNCRFETMTKEQIITAIAQATGSTPIGFDDAFITKIKDINTGTALSLWIGTAAEYNALETKSPTVLYIMSDKSDISDLTDAVTSLSNRIDGAITLINNNTSAINGINSTVAKCEKKTSIFSSSAGKVIPYNSSLSETTIYTHSSSLVGKILEIHWKVKDQVTTSTATDFRGIYVSRIKGVASLNCDFMFMKQGNAVNYVGFGLDSTGKKLQGFIYYNMAGGSDAGVYVTNIYICAT